MLGLQFPLVMAPMFLVSNESMVTAAMESGILGCFPSLNYRTANSLDKVLDSLNEKKHTNRELKGTFGMNLIVQRSNPWYRQHLEKCLNHKVPVVITSLGNPEETIEKVHEYGGRVFCDVTNLAHAGKCAKAQCDGFIAVGQGAGGHAGPFPLALLVESLKKNFPGLPVLAAGGIANGRAILSVLASGASAAYCGTRFIASSEATVSQEYKDAILSSGMQDIVMTERISGTPCTIINTPFAKKVGLKQNLFEKWMSQNPRTKKYFKMLIQKRGFNWLEAAIKPGNYQNLWCAGQSVEIIHEILPVKSIVRSMILEFEEAWKELNHSIST
ncbi:MAG: nitronate monooxygenase [Bacteroidia bacterium]|nr:nitronate monooxygenase [Bacteroidia bacterium]